MEKFTQLALDLLMTIGWRNKQEHTAAASSREFSAEGAGSRCSLINLVNRSI